MSAETPLSAEAEETPATSSEILLSTATSVEASRTTATVEIETGTSLDASASAPVEPDELQDVDSEPEIPDLEDSSDDLAV